MLMVIGACAGSKQVFRKNSEKWPTWGQGEALHWGEDTEMKERIF